MQLLPPRPPAERDVRRWFRTSPWAPALAFVGILGFSAFFVRLGGPIAGSIPWFAWIVAAPMLLIVGSVLLLMLGIFFRAWRATLRGTNWIMAITREGVFLNLRSYLNAHLQGHEPTVAFVPFSEIASARRIDETWRQARRAESDMRQRDFLELVLSNADTASLADAIRVESAKSPPEHAFLGIKTKSRSSDVPVFVAAPGVVRVQWRRGMCAALEEHVRVLETTKVDLSREFAAATTEETCLALLQRGEKIAAVESARTGFRVGLAEARDRVEELERRSA